MTRQNRTGQDRTRQDSGFEWDMHLRVTCGSLRSSRSGERYARHMYNEKQCDSSNMLGLLCSFHPRERWCAAARRRRRHRRWSKLYGLLISGWQGVFLGVKRSFGLSLVGFSPTGSLL